MADNIYLRAGNKAKMPELSDREPAYVRDEEALYIGTPDGNKKLCSADTEERVTALEATKLSASKAAAQAELDLEADTAAVVGAFNSLIAAMKESGLMNS